MDGIIGIVVIVAVIIFISRGIKKRALKAKMKDPAFRKCLQETMKLQEICSRMTYALYTRVSDVDVIQYVPIDTYGNGAKGKKPVTAEDFKYSRTFICFQVHLTDVADLMQRHIEQYLEANRKIGYEANGHSPERAQRDALGGHIVESLFTSREDKNMFAKLTGLEDVDILFDCIDLHPDYKNDVVFHFKFYCFEFQNDRKMYDLLLKLLQDLNDPKKQQKTRKQLQKSGVLQQTRTDAPQNQGQYRIYYCTCGTKFRVPADKGHIIATCPKCKKKWDIK